MPQHHFTFRIPSVSHRNIRFLLAALLCCFSLAWAQPQSAARVMAVSGYAKIMDAQGQERNIEKGTELFAGDKILTSAGALVQLRLNDGGYMSVRPGTELVIDRFVHDQKEPSNSSFLVTLLQGGFRSITGLIGRTNPSGYQIRSSTATIGVRGTDHEPFVVPDTPGTPTLDPAGLYDKVNEGETYIRSAAGVLSLKPGDVGFAPLAPNLPPQVLLKVPDFYKVDVKTDARDGKDPSDGKRAAAGGLLRPSVAARREALSAADGAAAQPATPPGPADATPGGAQPAPQTQTQTQTTNNGSPTGSGLSAEQRRAAAQGVLSTITQKSDAVAPAAAPAAPAAPAGAAIAPIATQIAPKVAPALLPPAPAPAPAPR